MGSCHSKGYGDCQPESADNGNVHHIWKRFLSSTSNLEFGGTCNPTLDVTCANHLTESMLIPVIVIAVILSVIVAAKMIIHIRAERRKTLGAKWMEDVEDSA